MMMSAVLLNIPKVKVFITNHLDWKVIPYTGDPNEKGIIHWIGCLNEKREYINPFKQDMIRILTSRDYHVNYSRNECTISKMSLM